ncbi:MAG: hypothetical protein LBI63_03270 [Candidatus Ancillula sp.]|jgi:DNA-binding transcriptional ArsR family regulator|nr:hypothetical protein [Candidatus Ancillula sp.]
MSCKFYYSTVSPHIPAGFSPAIDSSIFHSYAVAVVQKYAEVSLWQERRLNTMLILLDLLHKLARKHYFDNLQEKDAQNICNAVINPYNAVLSKGLNMSIRTVQRYLRELEELHIIKKMYEGHNNWESSGTGAFYVLLLPKEPLKTFEKKKGVFSWDYWINDVFKLSKNRNVTLLNILKEPTRSYALELDFTPEDTDNWIKNERISDENIDKIGLFMSDETEFITSDENKHDAVDVLFGTYHANVQVQCVRYGEITQTDRCKCLEKAVTPRFRCKIHDWVSGRKCNPAIGKWKRWLELLAKIVSGNLKLANLNELDKCGILALKLKSKLDFLPKHETLSPEMLVNVCKDFFKAGFNEDDIVYALEFMPSGRKHSYGTKNIKKLFGWMKYRLSFWKSSGNIVSTNWIKKEMDMNLVDDDKYSALASDVHYQLRYLPKAGDLHVRFVKWVCEKFFEAGWDATDIMNALEFKPDGTRHQFDISTIKNLRAWLQYRLSFWLDRGGIPVESYWQKVVRSRKARLNQERNEWISRLKKIGWENRVEVCSQHQKPVSRKTGKEVEVLYQNQCYECVHEKERELFNADNTGDNIETSNKANTHKKVMPTLKQIHAIQQLLHNNEPVDLSVFSNFEMEHDKILCPLCRPRQVKPLATPKEVLMKLEKTVEEVE